MKSLNSDLSSQNTGICLCGKAWRQNQRKVVEVETHAIWKSLDLQPAKKTQTRIS